jgi:hypothetical protein
MKRLSQLLYFILHRLHFLTRTAHRLNFLLHSFDVEMFYFLTIALDYLLVFLDKEVFDGRSTL